jgi:hypothetical protein
MKWEVESLLTELENNVGGTEQKFVEHIRSSVMSTLRLGCQ